MAKIVCIDTGIFKSDINNIGDVVSIHDDDVDLSGGAYDTFKIIIIKGITAAEIQVKFNSLITKEIVSKYPINMDNLTGQDLDDLSSDKTKAEKYNILEKVTINA